MRGMARLVELTDASDPQLADYVSLRDTQLRHAIEHAEGLFITEGTKIIERAAAAGFRPRSFLLARRWLDQLDGVLAETDAPCYVLPERTIEALTGFHVHRGALASFHRGAERSPDSLLDADRLVVCEDIVDHTNVGAIIRVAAGLGWDGVLLAPRAADPLYRRAIKTSMGTVFSIPWARMADGDGLDVLTRAGFTVVALALRDDAVPLDELAAQVASGQYPKIAVLLGTEGDGLSDAWLSQADVVATIPMHRGVDSLNVATSAAIACYALGASNIEKMTNASDA